MNIRVEDKNLSYYNLSSFNNIGGGSLITTIGPYNYNANIKTVTATATSANGGYYNIGSQANTINPNMDYRFSCWIMVTGGTLSTGSVNIRPRTYADVNASYGATPFKDVTNTGSTSADLNAINVSYLNLPTYCPIGEWRLFSFILRNSGYTGNIDSPNTGIWKPDGTNIGIANGVGDLIMHSGVTLAGITVHNIQNATGTATIYSCYPRIDLVDGTEPSINTLLNNEGMWRSGTTYIKVEDKNLLDYSDWSTDLSGSTSEFTAVTGFNAQLNQYRQLDTDPFGNTNYIWVASGVTATGATYGGGWVSSGVTIDSTKTYRISQWCYRFNTGDTSNGYYFGFWTYNQNGTITGATRSDGAYNINYWTYQRSSASMSSVNGWFLTTGYLMPYTWTGNTTEYQGKIYYNNGLTHTSNAYNYKFNVNAKYLASRSYSPYDTTSFAGTKFCYPRIDLIDGTEPSINTLLQNEGMWRSGTTMIYVDDGWKNT